jgi:hypothetical protein
MAASTISPRMRFNLANSALGEPSSVSRALYSGYPAERNPPVGGAEYATFSATFRLIG